MVGVLEWWHGMALAAGDGARGLAVVVAVEWGARVVGVEGLAVVVVLGLSDDVADGAGMGQAASLRDRWWRRSDWRACSSVPEEDLARLALGQGVKSKTVTAAELSLASAPRASRWMCCKETQCCRGPRRRCSTNTAAP